LAFRVLPWRQPQVFGLGLEHLASNDITGEMVKVDCQIRITSGIICMEYQDGQKPVRNPANES